MKKTSTLFAPVRVVAQVAVLATALGAGISFSAQAAGSQSSFKEGILPILEKHCAECHAAGGQGEQASGLDLTSYEGVMKGTEHGPVVVPGDAFLSNMMVLIDGRAGPELKMPHGRKDLTRWEKTQIRRWINRGALND